MRLKVTGALLAMTLTCFAAADRNIGWRGDGSGRFPDADPPITWSRISRAIQGLHFQARKPKGTEPAGKLMPDGVVREWLILGPVPVPEVPKAIEQDTLPNELELSPDQGDKCGPRTWQSIAADSANLNFTALIGTNQNSFACAYTYIHSETGGEFSLELTHRKSARVLLNGKQVYAGQGTSGARVRLRFLPGWNRLLLKVAADDDSQWWATPILYAHTPRGYDENNIAWMTPLPGAKTYPGTPAGPGGPIVVGEKIFLLCEPHDLFCLNKEDGRILWVRSNSYFEALSDAEKNSNPAFQEIAPLAAKWNELNAEYLGNPKPKTPQQDRDKLEKNLYDALKKIDGKRFNRPSSQDVGYAGLTPASDGNFIYAWFASGVSACYDLDGRRQWIRIDNHQTVEHGFTSSPLLAGDKFVVFMRELMAFDVKTGREVWRNPVVGPTGMNPEGYFHGSCLSTRLGGVETVILPNATLIRASDGKILFKNQRIINKQQVASPVLDGDILCLMTSLGETLYLLRLPQAAGESLAPTILKELKIPTGQFPYFYLGWHIASPLIHDGLIYLMNNSGVLTVVDEKTGAIVYQKLLDLDHFENANEGPARGHGVSPAFAGKHIYFFGDAGAAVVIEPGRQFRQVAKNKLEGLAMPGTWGERQDRAVACPFFDGKRIFYRTESGLCALGK